MALKIGNIDAFGLPYLGAYPRSYLHEGFFPPGFAWALGTASCQIEGAWLTRGAEWTRLN